MGDRVVLSLSGGIRAAVAAHNAEAEPKTAGVAWRTAHEATVVELRRALGVKGGA